MLANDFLYLRGRALFGGLTLILAIIMVFVFPLQAELADGFRTPIIAFEFARSEADLAFLSSMDAAGAAYRQDMRAGQHWDTVFPFAYGIFLALNILPFWRKQRIFAALGLLFCIAVIPLDLNENRVLEQILRKLDAGLPAGELLEQLYIATWLKWGALGLSLAVLGGLFISAQRWLLATLALIAASLHLLCWCTGSGGLAAEAMAVSVSLVFLVLACQAWLELFRTRYQRV